MVYLLAFLHYQEHKYHIFEQCESPKLANPPKKQHIHTKYENEFFNMCIVLVNYCGAGTP